MTFHQFFEYPQHHSGVKGLKMIIHILVMCLASSHLAWSAPATQAFSKEEIQNMEQFAGDVMSCANIPGLALGVVRGDATFATGLGVADMHTGHPVGKYTTFNLGATSKAFLPFLIAELMKEPEYGNGRISWDKPLKSLMEGSTDLDIVEPWASMTLKETLVYMSGSSAADFATMVGLPNHITRDGLIRRLKFLPDTSEFRSSDHYSNHMYAVVSHIIERLTGKSWRELVKTRVFSRLGMSEANFSPMGMSGEDAAFPYRFHSYESYEPFPALNKTLFDIHPSDPVGSVMVSANDMTKWMVKLLRQLDGKGDNNGNTKYAFHEWSSLPANSKTELLKHDSQSASGYGMGWISSSYRGFHRYKYSGHLYAYSSNVWLFPESNSAVFLSVSGPNTEQGLRAMDGILFHVSDVVLGLKQWVSSGIACCCEDQDYDENEDDDYDYDNNDDDTGPAEYRRVEYLMKRENYVGKYGNNLVGNLIVENNRNGILYLSLGRNLHGELLPGDLDSTLMLHTKGALQPTSEWVSEKEITFLYTTSEEGKNFDKVRIKLHNGMVYDFERDKLFTSLTLVEQLNAELEKMKENHRKSNGVHKQVDESTENSLDVTQEGLVTPETKEDTTESKTTQAPTQVVTSTPTVAIITTETTKMTTSSTTKVQTTRVKVTNKIIEKTTVDDSDSNDLEETTVSVKQGEEFSTPNSKTDHEIFLQRDSNKSKENEDDGVDQGYLVKEKEYEGKSSNIKKPDARSPSRGRLIRHHDENSAQGFHRYSVVSLIFNQIVVAIALIFWKN